MGGELLCVLLLLVCLPVIIFVHYSVFTIPIPATSRLSPHPSSFSPLFLLIPPPPFLPTPMSPHPTPSLLLPLSAVQHYILPAPCWSLGGSASDPSSRRGEGQEERVSCRQERVGGEGRGRVGDIQFSPLFTRRTDHAVTHPHSDRHTQIHTANTTQ